MTRVFVPIRFAEPFLSNPNRSLILLLNRALEVGAAGWLNCLWCKGYCATNDKKDVFGHETDCPTVAVYRWVAAKGEQ